MKINLVILIVAVLVVASGVYYLNHHKITMNLDIKSDEGAKSQMKVKHDMPVQKDA